MKKYPIVATLFLISCAILSGCMITGPVVDDLNHYKKGDTYESIKEEREQVETITDSEKGKIDDNVEIDYGTSDIFSNEEIDEVMNLVLQTYKTQSSHPKVSQLYYGGDEKSLQQLEYFQNEMGTNVEKCLQIYSNFYIDGNIDTTDPATIFYTNDVKTYSRTACKYDLGDWELVNQGFM